jgi:tetratricopeptide (TPR) repeat protein
MMSFMQRKGNVVMNVNSRALWVLAISCASLISTNPAFAKKEKLNLDPVPTVKKVKPESPECAACCKEASKLFATGKSTDAYKLLKANQVNCKDSARFNLLLSTLLLRMPSHEKEAAQAAAQAVELDPSSVPALFQLGICQTASGAQEDAAATYEKLVKIDPTNYEAWSALGSLYSDLHETQKSKTCTAKAAVLEPNSRIAKIRTAQNLHKQGKTTAMIAELDRLITDDHLEPEFFIGLAKDALDMQAFAESIKAADRALAVYPNLTELLKTKSTAQLWKRNYNEGLETISRLDPSTRNEPDAMAIRALHLIKLGKTKDAKPLVSKLPTNTSKAPLAGLARAYMAERTGDVTEAVNQLESALRINQVFAPPHIELARLYLRQSRAEDVLAEAREVQRSTPYISSGKAFESRLALEDAPARERVAEALRLAREAVKLDGEDPEALVAMGLSDLKGGKIAEARESIQKAIEIEPGNIDVQLAEIKILEGEGKSADRLEALQTLREIAPGDTEVLCALADAHCDGGDMTSAIKLLRQHLDEGAAEPTVIFALARALERSGRGKEASKYFQKSLSDGLKGPKASLAREALKNLGASSSEN